MLTLFNIIEILLGCSLVLGFVVGLCEGLQAELQHSTPLPPLSKEDEQIRRWVLIDQTFRDWN